MPDINNSYQFPDLDLVLTKVLLIDVRFTFRDWGDPTLQNLRKGIRSFYRNEQQGICCYCKKDVSLQSVNNCHIEHIAPKSLYRNFIFEPKNFCVICADCNEIKREQETLSEVADTVVSGQNRKRYPRTTKAFRGYHPHFDIFDEHIEIVGNYFYVDKTKKGHFTIGACRLNRKLHAFGWIKEIVDESAISSTMNDFLKEKKSLKKAALLNKLRHQIINS